MNRAFGRNPSPYDSRDRIIRGQVLAPAVSKEWAVQIILDQGATPHCGGFAMAGFGNCAPVMDKMYDDKGHEFYYKCKVVEGEPGEENGVYMRSVATVLKNDGIIPGYGWLPTVDAAKQWVLKFGPILVGTIWTQDMFSPDADGRVYPTGRSVGGHAYYINGYDFPTDDFLYVNSWGDDFADNGHFRMRVSDFEKLIVAGGEMIAAVEKTSPMVNW